MGQLYDTYPHEHTTKGGQQVMITGYMPERYPQGVGSNYIGEVEGYTYIPAMNQGRGGYREGGQGTPEDPNAPGPSTWDQVKPVAAAGGALALGSAAMKPGGIKEIVSNVTDIPRDLYSWGKGSVEKAKGLLDGLTGAGASSASSAPAAIGADGFVTSEAANAAWNADAMAAGGVDAGSFVGDYAVPGAAAALGGYNLYKGLEKENPLQAGLGGGAAAWGVGGLLEGTGLLAANPVTLPYAVAAAVGLGLLAKSGILGHKSTKEYQAERRQALIDAGVAGYEDFVTQAMQGDQEYREKYKDSITNSRGFRSDIAPDFIGFDDSGRWINNKFAGTGDMSDLRPEDVWGSEGVFSTFGNDWLGKYSEDQRRQISQRLLDEGLFRSDKGDIIIHSDDQDRAREIAKEVTDPNKEEEEENQNG